MPGPIGATSGKFILTGAALLLHGGVDGTTVRIAIMPGAPTSAISPKLAEQLRDHRTDALKIHLRAETFRLKIDAVEPDIGANADLRIGQDVLDDNPVEIDFARHAVQPLSASEAKRLERHAQLIALLRESDGTLSITVVVGSAPPLQARLDLSSDVSFAAPDAVSANKITIGGVDLHGVDVTTAAQPIVGLYAFRHARVIFDLGHDRIWVIR